MIAPFRTFGAVAIAAGLITAASPIHAQEGDAVSEEAVAHFFDEMEQEVTAMVEAGDFDGLVAWTDQAIADEAHFFVSVEAFSGEDRKTFSLLTLSKQEVTQLGRVALGLMSGAQGDHKAIEDYALDFQVKDVTPAGPGAATVTAHITESATLALRQGESADSAGTEGNAGTDPAAGGEKSLSLKATADCHMLIRRADDGERLLIGLSACNASLRH